MSIEIPGRVLPIIVFSQFAGGSLWFAGNAVVPDLQQEMGLGPGAAADIISAVQLGFIAGTLVFAFFSLADRFRASRIFLWSCLLGAVCNLIIVWWATGLTELLIFRFLTGVCLAGIYPVGMKVTAQWYHQGLGKALGYLVGALVLGKALPYLIRGLSDGLSWQSVLLFLSVLAAVGGWSLAFLVGEGPYRHPSPKFNWRAVPQIFAVPACRRAAFGYFGHMWELYTVWTFIPLLLLTYNATTDNALNVSLGTFVFIGMGTIGCIVGGYLSLRRGSAWVAFAMLVISGICCVISPALFVVSPIVLLLVLAIWGFAVVGDSAQFSAIVAQTAPRQYVGTALTVVNGLGFALTVVSIQLFDYLQSWWPVQYAFVALSVGPIFGLWAIRYLLSRY